MYRIVTFAAVMFFALPTVAFCTDLRRPLHRLDRRPLALLGRPVGGLGWTQQSRYGMPPRVQPLVLEFLRDRRKILLAHRDRLFHRALVRVLRAPSRFMPVVEHYRAAVAVGKGRGGLSPLLS